MDTNTQTVPAEVQTILRFWFGDDDTDDRHIAERQSALWWGKDDANDARIRADFSALHQRAIRGELSAWLNSPRGRLALIILVDQFSRVIFRNTPRAWASDALALQWCVDGLALRQDQDLRPIERVFFYLPLEHAEHMLHQHAAVACFEALEAEVDAQQRAPYAQFSAFAHSHRDVIARFGRFPHRNALLGRSSTPAEQQYLQQPGAGF